MVRNDCSGPFLLAKIFKAVCLTLCVAGYNYLRCNARTRGWGKPKVEAASGSHPGHIAEEEGSNTSARGPHRAVFLLTFNFSSKQLATLFRKLVMVLWCFGNLFQKLRAWYRA